MSVSPEGEWFGPFIAAAVGLSPQEILNLRLSGAQDSKNMSLSSMKEIQEIILRKRIPMKIWYFRPETYNQRYIKFQEEGQTLNDMLAWTHTKAIEDVLSRGNFTNAQVVIDKFDLDATEFRLGKVRRFKVSIIQKSKGESEIPVAVASILAKLRFEEEVDKLNHQYGLDLRRCKPTDVPPEILPPVAKLHFKNVQQATFQT